MKLPGVSICFPAFNEEASISSVLLEAREKLSASGVDYEILVCDDGSKDQTGKIADRLSSQIPEMRVLHHSRNLGIRATFEHLYAEARKEFVFLNSTDGQWDTKILFEMLPLTRDADIVIASRIAKHYGPVRRFISWAFNCIPLYLFGVPTFDAGAVKLTKREIIERFKLVSRSPFAEAERIIRASRAGYRITNYPVTISSRQTGRSHGVNVRVLLHAIGDVPRVWWSLSRERIGPRSQNGLAPMSELK